MLSEYLLTEKLKEKMADNSNNNEQKTDEFSEHLKVKEKDE